jgi:hypothetical protein
LWIWELGFEKRLGKAKMEPHKIIYLQVIDEKTPLTGMPSKFITWCQEKISVSDVEYIRKDIFEAMCEFIVESSGSCPADSLLGWELSGGCAKVCKNQAAECWGKYFCSAIY